MMMRLTALAVLVACALWLCGCSETEKPLTPPPVETPSDSGSGEDAEPAGDQEGDAEAPADETQETQETGEAEEGEDMPEEAGAEEVEVGVMETDFGTIVMEFYPDLAPKTVARIKELIKSGHYDGLIFHRVVPGFCIQGGDPTGTGSGGTGVKIPGEFTKTPYVDGSVGMARTQDPNSNDCQFFITLGRTANLDNQYTLFGNVIEGLDVVHKIEKVETVSSRPKEDVHIKTFKLEKRTLDK